MKTHCILDGFGIIFFRQWYSIKTAVLHRILRQQNITSMNSFTDITKQESTQRTRSLPDSSQFYMEHSKNGMFVSMTDFMGTLIQENKD